VIDLPTQLRNFEEVRKSLEEKLGEEKSNELISEAVYFISIGSNDYMGGYLGNPKMQEKYNPEQYIGIVIGNLTQAIQVRICFNLFSFFPKYFISSTKHKSPFVRSLI
jgi:hypothetical protein